MIVVSDAGPLIYLGGAGELDLLRKLYDEVVVPRVVYDEVVLAGAGLSGAQERAELPACRNGGRSPRYGERPVAGPNM